MKPPRLRALAVASLLLVACHKSGSDASPGGGAGGAGGNADTAGSSPDGGAAGPVTGTDVDTYLTERGEETSAPMPGKVRISALVPNSAGGFTTLVGSFADGGSFTIPVVPPGEYYLRLDYADGMGNFTDPLFIVTRERKLDLGALLVGRADWQAAQDTSTTLAIEADGLVPWQAGDGIELYSLNTNSQGYALDGDFMPMLMPGDTHAHAYLSLVANGLHALDAAQGDTIMAIDLSGAKSGDVPYVAARAAFLPAPFTVADGHDAIVTGSFAPLPQRTASLTWNRDPFAALASDVNPNAKLGWHTLSIYADPAGAGRSSLGSTPDVAEVSIAPDMMPPRDQRLDLSFGDPAPASWPLVVGYSTSFAVGDELDGTIGGWLPLEDAQKAPLTAVITPPRVLRVEGGGTTPKISWDPPAVGQAAYYVVTLYQRNAMTKDWEYRANLWTEGRQVVVPRDVLQAEGAYMVIVSAQTNYDPKAPYKNFPTNSYADTVSDEIAP